MRVDWCVSTWFRIKNTHSHKDPRRARDKIPALFNEPLSYLDLFCLSPPPSEHTSEGGRDDRGVPYHAESTLSSDQVIKQDVGLIASALTITQFLRIRNLEVGVQSSTILIHLGV